MTEFHALTRPAFQLIRSIILRDDFTLTLDGVRIASMYLDRHGQEWALVVDASLDILPPPFEHWVYTFPTWAEVNAFLGIEAPQPVEVENNTVEDVADMALRKAGRATYGEMRAELARRDATPAPDFGIAVAEHRRLRDAHALVAAGIRSALVEIDRGNGRAGLVLLAEAHDTATHHAGYSRPEVLPDDVPVLSRIRAERHGMGARS